MNVTTGTVLSLRTPNKTYRGKVLRLESTQNEWNLYILADLSLIDHPSVTIELPTSVGLIVMDGCVQSTTTGLVFTSPRGTQVQRRDDYRQRVEIEVRAALCDNDYEPLVDSRIFEGKTVELSAGGMKLGPDFSEMLPGLYYVELYLPDDLIIPATIERLVGNDARCRFVKINPIHVEKLVKFLFRVQRKQLSGKLTPKA